MEIKEILCTAISKKVSDIFIVAGFPVSGRINGRLVNFCGAGALMPSDCESLLAQIYALAGGRDMSELHTRGDDDFSISVQDIGRFRCSAYKQRGSAAAVLRVVTFTLPCAEELGIPPQVVSLADTRCGLVLVTGSAGSGKSTTLACMIDRINSTRDGHIITIEDPIEYLHRHKKCIVSQREVANDTDSYMMALRAALRQAPSVILLGEMRDFETIQTAMTAAETGQLVLSTLHTIGAAKTIDRIIDVFPPLQQQQIRVQLSMVLQAVVSQQLVATVDGGLIPVFEIMRVNSAIRTMIRDGKVYQIDNVIATSSAEGMASMDAGLLSLTREGRITPETALLHAVNPDAMAKKLG